MADTSSSSYLSGWRLFVVIACLFFGSFLIALDTNIINVAIPRISSDFKALEDVAWYGTSYLLTLTAFQPIYGSLYKHFRTDIVYRLSIVVFEIGSLLCATATSSPMFIVGRTIAGLGAAGVLQGALSIIGQVVSLEKRPLYMGIVISVFAIAVCVGPPLGGAFTQHTTWRWCFWVNLPIGGVVLVLLTLFLKVRGDMTKHRTLPLRQKMANLDIKGCIVFIGSVCCLLLALQWGGQSKPWSSATVIGLLVGFFLIAALFIYMQWRRKDTALIPLRVLLKRSILTSAFVLFFLGASQYLNVFFLPFYFEAVRDVTPVMTGVYFIPLLLSQIIALVFVGAVVKTWGHYVPYILLGEAICIAGTAMLTQLNLTTSTAKWAAYLVLSGIGMGTAMQLPYTAIHVTLSDDDLPTGNAIAVLFYQLGGALAISMGQTITISTIIDKVPKRLPLLPTSAVVQAGAANLHVIAPSADALLTLKDIWNTAITRTMILSVVLVAAAVPFTFAMEWKNAVKIAKEKEVEVSDTVSDPDQEKARPTETAVELDKAEEVK